MSDSESIDRLRAQFVASFNREDISTLSDLITEDNVAMPPNRPTLRGKDGNIAFWREGFAAAESRVSITPEELEVQGDLAIDRFRYVMESALKSGGDVMRDEGKNIWLWRRQDDGAWKIARAIWNSDLPHGQTVWTGAASSASALTAADRETLRDLVERQWPSACVARDWDTVLGMCAEGIVYMPADHPALRGHAELRAWFEQFPRILEFTQPLGEVEGDTRRTVARATFDAAIEVAGQPVEISGKVLCTLGKDPSGKWLVQSVCWNFDRPMASAS